MDNDSDMEIIVQDPECQIIDKQTFYKNGVKSMHSIDLKKVIKVLEEQNEKMARLKLEKYPIKDESMSKPMQPAVQVLGQSDRWIPQQSSAFDGNLNGCNELLAQMEKPALERVRNIEDDIESVD